MAKDKGKKSGKKADWEKELEKEASKERAREKGGGGGGLANRISTKARRFTLDGENLGRTMKCVVIDFAYLRTFFGKAYDEDGVNLPRCFAIDADADDLAPHENVKKPVNDICETCPKNEWGSGRGRSKACGDRRRLALIHEDDLEDVAEATVAYLELAPTTIKHWAKFIKECSDKLNRPFYTVIANLGFDEDEDYPCVTFEIEEKIKDKELIDAIKEKREEIRDELLTPFDETTAGSDDDEDEDDEDSGKKSKKAKKQTKAGKAKERLDKRAKKRDEDEDDEDEDEDEEDEDDEEEDEKPKRKGKGKPAGKRKPARRDEEDEEDDGDDDEDDDEDDEEDDEDDEAPAGRGKGKRGGRGGGAGKRGRKSDDDGEDDDDEEDEDEDEDEEGEEDEPKGKGKGKVKTRKGSRFGKR